MDDNNNAFGSQDDANFSSFEGVFSSSQQTQWEDIADVPDSIQNLMNNDVFFNDLPAVGSQDGREYADPFPNVIPIYECQASSANPDYGFRLHFGPQDQKNAVFMYSVRHNKLYVKKNEGCSINFVTEGDIPHGAIIRAYAEFIHPQYVNDVVERCNDDMVSDTVSGDNDAPHLIRCISDQAVYYGEVDGELRSVVVPYNTPERGVGFSTYIYKFTCFSSCKGGINGRATRLVFTLECQNVVLGLCSVDLKICASPTRDIKTENKVLQQELGLSNDASERVVRVDPCSVATLNPPVVVKEENVYRPKAAVTACLPPSNNWEGDYEFRAVVGNSACGRSKKGSVYSEVRDKLYVIKDTPCPISFSTQSPVPGNTRIRAMAIFSQSKHISDVVARCGRHIREDESKGISNANHLIHCNGAGTNYDVDGITFRHSVLVPYYNYGNQGMTYHYIFRCFGACAGGLNRRPIKVIFTLENGGQVLGRRTLDVKICASPVRDCNNDDNHAKGRKRKHDPRNSGHIPPKRRETSTVDPATLFSTFNVMDTSNLEEPHGSIEVDDAQEYSFLTTVLRLYRLARQLRPTATVVTVKEETTSSDEGAD